MYLEVRPTFLGISTREHNYAPSPIGTGRKLKANLFRPQRSHAEVGSSVLCKVQLPTAARSTNALHFLCSPHPHSGRNQVTMSTTQADGGQRNVINSQEQSTSGSSSFLKDNTVNVIDDVEKGAPQEGVEETEGHPWISDELLRSVLLVSLALLILAWWISSIVLPATRNRWSVFQISNFVSILPPARSVISPRVVQTFWAWTFIL